VFVNCSANICACNLEPVSLQKTPVQEFKWDAETSKMLEICPYLTFVPELLMRLYYSTFVLRIVTGLLLNGLRKLNRWKGKLNCFTATSQLIVEQFSYLYTRYVYRCLPSEFSPQYTFIIPFTIQVRVYLTRTRSVPKYNSF
jgi:hypothetical protein